jgi:hypothetical protein
MAALPAISDGGCSANYPPHLGLAAHDPSCVPWRSMTFGHCFELPIWGR